LWGRESRGGVAKLATSGLEKVLSNNRLLRVSPDGDRLIRCLARQFINVGEALSLFPDIIPRKSKR
jgi:hypothetical protein